MIGVKRLFLHAAELEFSHPETKEKMSFEAPVPDEFDTVMNYFQ